MNIHFSIRDRFSKCFNCFLESVSPLLITSFTFFAVIDLFFLFYTPFSPVLFLSLFSNVRSLSLALKKDILMISYKNVLLIYILDLICQRINFFPMYSYLALGALRC